MGSREFALGAELALRGAGVKDVNQRTAMMQRLQQFQMDQNTRQQDAVNTAMAKYQEIMTPRNLPVSEWEPAFGTTQAPQPSFDELARGLFPYLLQAQPGMAMQMLTQAGTREDPNAAMQRQMIIEAFKARLGGYKPQSLEDMIKLQQSGLTPPKQSFSPVNTSNRGVLAFNHATGQFEQPNGGPYMPIQADVGLVGAKKAIEEDVKIRKERQVSFPKAKANVTSLNRQWDTVDRTIDKALAQIGPFSTGFGAYMKSLPASQAKNLEENLNTIKANIGFDKLQDMRANSPTGGALGQVSELENRLLQATQGSLDQFQSDTQLKANLLTIKANLQALRAETDWKFNATYQDILNPGVSSQGGAAPTQTIKYDASGKRIQ